MEPSLFVRPLSWEEQHRLNHKVRSRDLFIRTRAQIILGSAQGASCQQLRRQMGCSVSQVRLVIGLFNQQGTSCLIRGSNRPKSCAPLLDEEACAALQHLLHQSPRLYGCSSSLWSLPRLAEVAFAQGITPHQVSDETLRRALVRLGVRWKRAKQWISSPDPHYTAKKNAETA